MKSREEQLTWAKQRALICVDMGRFADAVAGLRADLAENPLTKGVISSELAMRGYKAAVDAALGRSSQALTEWIEERRIRVFHYYLNTLLGQPTALPLAAFFT
jgi:hypothetical protein